MLKRLLLTSCLIYSTLFLLANGPVLLFSDIESGPNTGWSISEPNKGAAVSIWGTGFGDIRGESYISVNGIALNDSDDYAVWGDYWPSAYYQRITFWLNDLMMDGMGEITITVEGLESNPLPFTIRSGEIYFITESNPSGDGSLQNPFDVHNSNYNWVDNMQPGDLYYFRDSHVYDGEYNGGNSVLWIRDSEPSGTETLPIALLGFPGEKPEVAVPTVDVNHHNGITLSNNYMVFSGFFINSEWRAASMAGDFHRFIGNDAVGLKEWYGSGTGIVTSGNSSSHTGDGNKFLGNAVHGGNSQNRFDHALYLSGCADNTGAEVGWNVFYDNNFGRGPIISINHQDDRCAQDQVLDAHFIFNNIIDCASQRSRAIGVYDLSYDEGEEAPEPTYVYNNLIIRCGTFDGENTSHVGYAPAMEQTARGSAHFYNNTLYDAGYIGFRIHDNSTGTSLKNNIIHMTSNLPGPTGNHYLRLDVESNITLSNNLYYGLGDYDTCLDCVMDQDNINNQDPLFASENFYNFKLKSGSPANGSGTSDLDFELAPPSYAPIDRDLNFVPRSSPPSLGAYEFSENSNNVEEITDVTNVKIYPNPVQSNFTLQFNLIKASLIGIEIYDVMGQLKYSSNRHVDINNSNKLPSGINTVQIETQDLTSGMYYLKVSSENNSLVQKIIVK